MKKLFILFYLLVIFICVDAQTSIKVMSYNIRLNLESDGENKWEARKDRLVGLINFYEPDFAGCQEVTNPQYEYMLNNLNGYASIGVGRDDGKTGGEYSNIFYKKDKYRLIKQSTFWLSSSPDSVTMGWDAACKRVCTYGLFIDKKTKKTFFVFNTHLDHIGVLARMESVKLILSKIKMLNPKNIPVILTGDFNVKPEDPVTKLVNEQMHNCRSISKLVYGNAETFQAFKFNEKPFSCIDYIFVNKRTDISVSKFITITDSYDLKYPSDHLPVMADISINSK